MINHQFPDEAKSVPSTTSGRIQSVARSSQILLWVAQQPEGAAVRQISEAIGLTLPTTYHLVNTLADAGLLAKKPDRRYTLGWGAAVLAQAFLRDNSVPEDQMAALRALAERTGETAYLAAWGGNEMHVLASVEGHRVVRVAEVDSGEYVHAHARANGKILLAFATREMRERYLRSHPLVPLTHNTITDPQELERDLGSARELGYCFDEEEYAVGVSCIGAPILCDGHLLGALGVSIPTERFRNERNGLLEILREVLASLRSGSAATNAPVGP